MNLQGTKRGSKVAIALLLAKRPEGVTQKDAYQANAGTRLAAQIDALKDKGHQFRSEWETSDGSRYKRYFWEGYSPQMPTKMSVPSYIGEEAGGVPPLGEGLGHMGGGGLNSVAGAGGA